MPHRDPANTRGNATDICRGFCQGLSGSARNLRQGVCGPTISKLQTSYSRHEAMRAYAEGKGAQIV